MNDVAMALLRSNLAASAALLAVLALRPAVRRWFGAETAYWLWAAPPMAALAILIPGRMADEGATVARGLNLGQEASLALLAAWLIGLAGAVALLWLSQAAFLRSLRAGKAGPAVFGVICPRIVMPRDDQLYSSEERAVIREHEREHIERLDPRAQVVMVLLQCLFWFNPLVHLAAHRARLDQELACDAAVVRRRPGLRALYAKTLLKTQLAATPLPFGCYWPARGRHPLETRIALLRSAERPKGVLGPTLVGAAVLIISAAAWMAQPPIPQAPALAAAPSEPVILAYLSRGDAASWPSDQGKR